MKQPQLKESSFNIVLLGKFNPHIFHPIWFVHQKLLGEKEGESAKLNVVHPDITIFDLEWLRFEVTPERLVASTKFDHAHDSLFDLLLGTFTILSHTPLSAVGINSTFDFTVTDTAMWHHIGDTLAPKDIWKKILEEPGLHSLVMKDKSIEKEYYRNMIQVTVSATKIERDIKMHINDHYELLSKESVMGADEVIKILETERINTQKKALNIKDNFFKEII